MLARIYRENQSLINDRIEPNVLSQMPKRYSDGELDGQTNLNPSHPEDWDYWAGYSQGNREYWCRRKGISLPDEF